MGRKFFVVGCVAFFVGAVVLATSATTDSAKVVPGKPIRYCPDGEWVSYEWEPVKKIADGWELRRVGDPDDVVIVPEADLLRR